MNVKRWMRARPFTTAIALLFIVPSAQAQTDGIMPPIGGQGGGQFIARCAQGQLLTGFELRTGFDVDAIRPICVEAYGPLEVGPPASGGIFFGGDRQGFRPIQLLCLADAPIVTGMYVYSWGERAETVNSIHLFCGVAGPTQLPSEFPAAVFNGKPFWSGNPARSHGTQRCPAGFVAVGITGRATISLDAVGLICGAPKLTPSVRPVGRVKLGGSPTGPPRAICDLARQARARNSPAAPGLERSCRAAGAAGEIAPVRPQGRVKLDTTDAPTIPPRPICDLAQQARARNSPAAPGLEQRCRADLAARAAAPVEAAPTITANPNPVLVPNGDDAGTTTITWTAGPAYTYCEIYLSVDNGPWNEFARGGDSSKPTTIKPGTSQTFRMMVYEGQAGTPQIIATLTVTAQ